MIGGEGGWGVSSWGKKLAALSLSACCTAIYDELQDWGYELLHMSWLVRLYWAASWSLFTSWALVRARPFPTIMLEVLSMGGVYFLYLQLKVQKGEPYPSFTSYIPGECGWVSPTFQSETEVNFPIFKLRVQHCWPIHPLSAQWIKLTSDSFAQLDYVQLCETQIEGMII